MGLDVPELDDRTYEELLDQATKLIPAYSDEWTDFNPHDPGITILELLAWLTETHGYQLDQVTDAHHEKYLRLIGHRRRPPRPASARLRLRPPAAAAGTRLPAGTALSVADGTDDGYRFETDHDVVLATAALSHVVTVDAAGETDNTEANRTDGMFYRPFGDAVERGDAWYLGFDRDPFATSRSLTLAVDYRDEDLPAPSPPLPGESSVAFEPSVALAWAYREPETGAWRELTVATDETSALYEGGPIELVLPDDGGGEVGGDGADGEAGRDSDGEGGGGDGAPHGVGPVRELPTEKAAADRVEGAADDRVWLRCRVETPGYEIPPQLNAVETNVVTASHRASVADETLRRVAATARASDEPTALDGQTFAFANESIRSATVRVDGERFVEVPDFDASGPDDPHYVLDRERGRVTFGDGRNGRVPPADATVTADYVYGGGEAGNVSASAVWRLADPDGASESAAVSDPEASGSAEESASSEAPDAAAESDAIAESDATAEPESETSASLADVDVEPAGPATGGADGESVADALRRARRDLRRPYRAVTEDDYRYLAARTPGLRIGRTNVVVEDGTITVVVVPYAPPDVPAPAPSEGFLRTVRRHLRERAILTDRVRVRGPRYAGLEVTVTGRTRPRYADGGHEAAVEDAVAARVHPLYGGDGDGWPFGRTLVADELAAAVAELDAIDRVTDVSITAHGGTTIDDGTVRIDDAALFAVEDVTVDLTAATARGVR